MSSYQPVKQGPGLHAHQAPVITWRHLSSKTQIFIHLPISHPGGASIRRRNSPCMHEIKKKAVLKGIMKKGRLTHFHSQTVNTNGLKFYSQNILLHLPCSLIHMHHKHCLNSNFTRLQIQSQFHNDSSLKNALSMN